MYVPLTSVIHLRGVKSQHSGWRCTIQASEPLSRQGSSALYPRDTVHSPLKPGLTQPRSAGSLLDHCSKPERSVCLSPRPFPFQSSLQAATTGVLLKRKLGNAFAHPFLLQTLQLNLNILHSLSHTRPTGLGTPPRPSA